MERESLRIAEKPGGAEPGQNKAHDLTGLAMTELLPEFLGRMKMTLGSIRNMAQLSRDRFKDPDFERYFQHSVGEDIAKIESVLNGLLDFMNISYPIVKSNTVHRLLDEALDGVRKSLQKKAIRLVKEFQKDLPETVVHEEQLRYMFSSVLLYAVSSATPNGSIGIRTRSVAARLDKGSGSSGSIEIAVAFTGYQKPAEQTAFTSSDASLVNMEKSLPNASWRGTPPSDRAPSSVIPTHPGGPLPASKGDLLDLILKLVQGLVQKSQGKMTFDVDEKKLRTYISLLLPIERRKVFFFPKGPAAPPGRSF